MRHKNVEVTPYKHTYRLFHKPTGEICGEFDCLLTAINVAKSKPKKHFRQSAISYTLKLEPQASYRPYSWRRVARPGDVEYYPPAEWVILTDLGDIVTEEDIKDAYRNSPSRSSYGQGWEARDARRLIRESRLVREKGSPAKVKLTCARVLSPWGGSYGRSDSYDAYGRSYYRRVRTQSERRVTEGHIDEYGPGIVRTKRHPFQLPDSWDDYPASIWDTEANWKHHSKRRKQWIPG